MIYGNDIIQYLTATELTITSGAITITQGNHKLQPESSTSDDLATISGTSDGNFGVLYVSDFGTDTITIKHNTGNILCVSGADISLSNGCVFWYSNGTKVFVSGDGGASGGALTLPQINDTSSDHQYIFAVNELAADRTITLPLLLGNDVFVFADFIQTLTNKRITRRKTSETSSATPTINTDNCDCHQITALAAAITSFTTNLSGTPTDGQELDIEILDNGTARAITWGASFASGPATLPSTTILSKWLYAKLRWSSSRSKWICLATGSEQ